MISDIEFQALQGKFDSNAFNTIMHDLEPTKDQLLRILRQVDFYIDTLESFGKEDLVEESMKELKKALLYIL